MSVLRAFGRSQSNSIWENFSCRQPPASSSPGRWRSNAFEQLEIRFRQIMRCASVDAVTATRSIVSSSHKRAKSRCPASPRTSHSTSIASNEFGSSRRPAKTTRIGGRHRKSAFNDGSPISLMSGRPSRNHLPTVLVSALASGDLRTRGVAIPHGHSSGINSPATDMSGCVTCSPSCASHSAATTRPSAPHNCSKRGTSKARQSRSR